MIQTSGVSDLSVNVTRMELISGVRDKREAGSMIINPDEDRPATPAVGYPNTVPRKKKKCGGGWKGEASCREGAWEEV